MPLSILGYKLVSITTVWLDIGLLRRDFVTAQSTSVLDMP
jgi:hypothetical protein